MKCLNVISIINKFCITNLDASTGQNQGSAPRPHGLSLHSELYRKKHFCANDLTFRFYILEYDKNRKMVDNKMCYP